MLIEHATRLRNQLAPVGKCLYKHGMSSNGWKNLSWRSLRKRGRRRLQRWNDAILEVRLQRYWIYVQQMFKALRGKILRRKNELEASKTLAISLTGFKPKSPQDKFKPSIRWLMDFMDQSAKQQQLHSKAKKRISMTFLNDSPLPEDALLDMVGNVEQELRKLPNIVDIDLEAKEDRWISKQMFLKCFCDTI